MFRCARLAASFANHVVSFSGEAGMRMARSFGKKRVFVDPSIQPHGAPKELVIELNPYNKIRTIAKRSFLPFSHILNALCTRQGKYYFVKVVLGTFY